MSANVRLHPFPYPELKTQSSPSKQRNNQFVVGDCSNQQLAIVTLPDSTVLDHLPYIMRTQIWLNTCYFMSPFAYRLPFLGFAQDILSFCLETLGKSGISF